MNVFDLWAKISLDTSDYDNELDDAEKKANSFGDRLKNGLATAAKVGTTAITAASAAIGVLTKKSIDGYGEYEQLVGGVETLFKDSADVVMGYANNAYKTAGLSANEYMETVTSFSASLLQSLDGDTKKAAETADLAITDMADNANKMGTAMESIQNAYQGFAKQNYTMLDNLKLGYGGTKEEMQRLLEDAEKLSGQKFDLSSYADIVEAIHVVQTEMGITGTTAKEASVTIQGSVNAAKSAWENLIVGIADENANLEELVGNFVDSVATAGENIIPRVEQILAGMGQAVQTLAPIIAEQVPDLVASVLPSLVSAGAQLLVGLTTGLVGAVPELVAAVPGIVKSTADAIISNLPVIQKAGQELLSMFTDGIFSKLPDMLDKLPDIIDGFLDFITDNLPDVLDKGVEMLNEFVTGIINGIPGMLSRIPQIITSFVKFVVDNLPVIVEAGMDILANLVTGIINNLPEIGKAVGQIIGAVVTGVGDLLGSVVDVGKNIVTGLWEGITSKAEWIKDKVTGFFDGIVGGVKDILGIHSPSRVFVGIGNNMALGLGEGWDDEFSEVQRQINKDMDFGVANVDFASSGMGVITSAISGGNVGTSIGTSGEIVIPITLELDGEVLVQKTYRLYQNEASRIGPAMVQV